MKTFPRPAALATTLLLLAPTQALGRGLPDPGNSIIGTVVNLGGLSGGAVDPFVTKTVLIQDHFNNPYAGSTVTIEFRECSDIRIATSQPFHPGPLTHCEQNTVTAITGADGRAYFRIAGGAASGPGNPPGSASPCAWIRVDGVLLGRLIVGAFDNDLVNGVTPADLANWMGDRNAYVANPANYRGRSDYDGTGTVTPSDGSLILAVRGQGGSTSSGVPTCL
jgi:hypothetical protein